MAMDSPTYTIGMNFEAYKLMSGINASTLVHGLKSMLHLQAAISGASKEESPALTFGSQYHTMILENEEFQRTHVVMPDFGSMEGNVDKKGNESSSPATDWAKKQKREFMEMNHDKQWMSATDFKNALGMFNSIRSNEFVSEIIDTSDREVTLTATVEGVYCKGRVDLYDEETATLSDIKGCGSASPHGFGSDAAKYHYPFKMALYRKLLRLAGKPVERVLLIAIEKTTPFDMCVYELDEETLDWHYRSVVSVLQQYKFAKERDIWLGHAKGMDVRPIELPKHAQPSPEIDFSGTEVISV